MQAILRSGFLALAIMALAFPVNAGPFEDGEAAAMFLTILWIILGVCIGFQAIYILLYVMVRKIR